MTFHLSEVIRGWLGWCPNAQSRILNTPVQPESVEDTSPVGGSLKTRALNWLGLFRNQMLLLAIWFSVVGYLLLMTIGNGNGTMFLWGLLAGLLLSAFEGFRFWRLMNEVSTSGAVFLASLYDKVTVFVLAIVISIPLVISLGTSPAANMTMWNAVTAGFIFMIFWVQFLVVWIWEKRSNRHLQSDGMMLSMAREN